LIILQVPLSSGHHTAYLHSRASLYFLVDDKLHGKEVWRYLI